MDLGTHRAVFNWVPGLLADRGLIQGKRVGIDATMWCGIPFVIRASWAAMSGATMKGIQEPGGHLTISQAAWYMHLSPPHTSEASERMAQWRPT